MATLAEQLRAYADKLTADQAQQIVIGLLGLARRRYAPCLPDEDGQLPPEAAVVLLRAARREARGLQRDGATVSNGPFRYGSSDRDTDAVFTPDEVADLRALCGDTGTGAAAPRHCFPLARPVIPEREWSSARRW